VPISDSTQAVTLPESGLTALFGIADENLRAIEDAFGVRLQSRGSEVSVLGEGEREDAARRLLRGLSDVLAAGYPLRTSDVATAIRVTKEDPSISLVEFFTDSPFGPTLKSVVTVRNSKQRIYVQTIDRHDLVFAIGPAGTGKTYLAVAAAVHALRQKKVDRIILVRPAVEAGESLGFLPGDMQEKVDPYLRPMYDALADLMSFDKMRRYIELGVIEIAPLAFMRGRTLHSSYVILDEAQNTTVRQMKMFLTRMGVNSRAVITGDVTQIDLRDPDSSGLVKIQSILGSVADIKFIYFHPEDVVRHRLVRDIIRAFDSYHARQNGKHEDGVGTALDPAAHDAPPGEGTGGAGNGGPEGAAGPGGPETLEEGGMGRGPSL